MEQPIHTFYQSLKNLDPEGIRSVYHPEVRFEDPAFGVLKGDRAMEMWEMLLSSAQRSGLKFEFGNVVYADNGGTGECEAWYTFQPTGRKVHNRLKGEFTIIDGMIISHTDRFDLYRWSRQAFGWKGWLLGWSSYFKTQLQKSTNKALDRYIAHIDH